MGNNFNFNGTINQFGNNNAVVKTVEDTPDKRQIPEIPLDPWKVNLLEQAAKGNLREVLTESARLKNDEHIRRQIMQLMGRLHKLEEDTIAGTMNKQDEVFELNQIRNAVLLFVERL
jgi:Effector-associated domain 11